MGKTLYQKVWENHIVKTLQDGRDQVFIGLHLVHEVTSPQAFGMLKEKGLRVKYPGRTFATVDHIIPTDDPVRPFQDAKAEEMVAALYENTQDHDIKFFDPASNKQGIIHVIGPELGLTQPGMTICCGDSHTSTHGAFGALAFGIGTSQVRDVLATQTLAIKRLKVRRIEIEGVLGDGVYAKDVILHVIRQLGVHGGVGFAYEFGGSAIDSMEMEARMTLCNMAIEGGARIGYVNPDQKTFEYLKGRAYAPDEKWEEAKAYWTGIQSDPDADYDDLVRFEAEVIKPTLTWGVNPAQAIEIGEALPVMESESAKDAAKYMHLGDVDSMLGVPVDVAFIGSCTNGRLSDLREVARVVQGHKVHERVRALIVPGSMKVALEAEAEGISKVLRNAGFEVRQPGCSMCLAMNPDKLVGDELCVSSSNRNFKGRQGSSSGRTVLMSPVMVAAAAVTGAIADPREAFGKGLRCSYGNE
ncbi:MAG: 3-isopropylmalate dehydratase large subunit [Myxococcota bacterium]|nr:3-isopropylmalate dehydratase large subunit [Myxococcota bacterium]